VDLNASKKKFKMWTQIADYRLTINGGFGLSGNVKQTFSLRHPRSDWSRVGVAGAGEPMPEHQHQVQICLKTWLFGFPFSVRAIVNSAFFP